MYSKNNQPHKDLDTNMIFGFTAKKESVFLLTNSYDDKNNNNIMYMAHKSNCMRTRYNSKRCNCKNVTSIRRTRLGRKGNKNKKTKRMRKTKKNRKMKGGDGVDSPDFNANLAYDSKQTGGANLGAGCPDPNFSIYNTNELSLFPYRPF